MSGNFIPMMLFAFFGLAILTVPVVLSLIFAALVRSAFNRARGRKLQGELSLRGYPWITIDDARLLYQELGNRAWQIPPVEELGVVPGFEEGSVELLLDEEASQ